VRERVAGQDLGARLLLGRARGEPELEPAQAVGRELVQRDARGARGGVDDRARARVALDTRAPSGPPRAPPRERLETRRVALAEGARRVEDVDPVHRLAQCLARDAASAVPARRCRAWFCSNQALQRGSERRLERRGSSARGSARCRTPRAALARRARSTAICT
jgi:hypothetical protein